MIKRILAIAVCALALAGCVSDPGDGIATASGGEASDVVPEATPSLSDEERMLKFAECMREQGIEMDDPQFSGPVGGGGGMVAGGRIGGAGESAEEMQAALEACREYVVLVDGNAPLDPAAQEQMLKFAQCMRDHGVEAFPDPDGNRMLLAEDITTDPDFAAAQEACAQEFGGPAVRTGGGRS
jgi:hypothetical protein